MCAVTPHNKIKSAPSPIEPQTSPRGIPLCQCTTCCGLLCDTVYGSGLLFGRAVLFGSYLIITKIEDVYEVSLPPAIKEILGMLSVGVSFGFDGVSTVLECLGVGSGYVGLLTLYMVAPAVLALLLLLFIATRLALQSRLSAQALFEAWTPLFLKLCFIAYPLVTNVAFDAFSCVVRKGQTRRVPCLRMARQD